MSSSTSHPPGFSPPREDGEFIPVRSLGNECGVAKEKEKEKIPEFKPGGELCRRPLVFSLFVDNLPANVNTKWLYITFGKFGRVVDAYIPGHRRRGSKSLFGFVRFFRREDASAALSKLNGYWMGSNQLMVQIAKYGKIGGIHRWEAQAEGSLDAVVKGCDLKSGHGGGNRLFVGSRSFAQVVSGEVLAGRHTEVVEGKLKVAGVPSSLNWLPNCIVAKFRLSPRTSLSLAALSKDLQGLLRIMRWGGRKFFLVFSSRALCVEAMAKLGSMDVLDDFHIWNGELVNTERLTWIICDRMPLSVWNRNSFQAIAALWGSLISMDDATANGLDFSSARLLIESDQRSVGGSIVVSAHGQAFEVFVREDSTTALGGAWPESEFPWLEAGGCSDSGSQSPAQMDGSSQKSVSSVSRKVLGCVDGKGPAADPTLGYARGFNGKESRGEAGEQPDARVTFTNLETSQYSIKKGLDGTSFLEDKCTKAVDDLTIAIQSPFAANEHSITSLYNIDSGPDRIGSTPVIPTSHFNLASLTGPVESGNNISSGYSADGVRCGPSQIKPISPIVPGIKPLQPCYFSNLISRRPKTLKIGPSCSVNLSNKSTRKERKDARLRQSATTMQSDPAIQDEIVNTRKIGDIVGVCLDGVSSDCIRNAILGEKADFRHSG